MLEVMTAKNYSLRTGYPLETIRRMCRDGDLPCDKRGKVYLIDVGAADDLIKRRMAQAQAEREGTRNIKQVKRRAKQLAKNKPFDFKAALKAL